ncbi:MAG: hypothetical protein K8T91_08185 [Planctomycetes bacterium]|nr:hypothetical protein [Planctomycetota bacterium]
MANVSLEKRVEILETKLDKLQGQVRTERKSKDWRRTIGAFTDDEGMQQILRDAMQLREADRKKARSVSNRKPQR